MGNPGHPPSPLLLGLRAIARVDLGRRALPLRSCDGRGLAASVLEAAGRVGRHPARPAYASRRPACVARAFRGLWAGEAGRNPGHSPCLFLSVCAHSHVRLRRRAWAAWWRAERARVPRMCMLPAGLVRLVCLARRGTLRRLRAA